MQQAIKFLKKINFTGEAEAFVVGGAVRDMLLGKVTKDFDISINIPPTQSKQLLQTLGLKVIDSGIKYGTVTALDSQRAYEVTSLRSDIKCFGRDAIVEYCDKHDVNALKKDAMRRDFTINALYLNDREELLDFFGGEQDLRNNIIRFIGDAQSRIREDYLRILRYVRFCCLLLDVNKLDVNNPRYNTDYEALFLENLAIIQCNIDGLDNISRERICQELSKIFAIGNWYRLLKYQGITDIFNKIFHSQNSLEYYANIVTHLQKLENINLSYQVGLARELIVYSLLLRNNFNLGTSNNKADNKHKDACRLIQKYVLKKKNSQYIYDIICSASIDINDDYSARKLLRKSERDLFFSIILYSYICDKISHTRLIELYNKTIDYKPPQLPLNGNILGQNGYKERKDYGELLSKAEEYWERKNYKPSERELLEFLRGNF